MLHGKKIILLISLIVCLNSCSGPRYLTTAVADPQELTGRYDLYLYGHRYSEDFKNIAFLIPKDEGHVFELYAAAFEYVIKRGLPAKTALAEAEKFVAFHYSFKRSQLNKIIDYEGRLVGYELRPLYSTLDFSYSDIFDIHYIVKDDKVIASVGLKPEIEEKPFEPFIIRPRAK